MQHNHHFVTSLVSAAAVFIYISFVAWLMFNGTAIFGTVHNFLVPLFILLLFVVSAAVTGLLVLGRPVQLYLGGAKREALTLLLSTLTWLVLFLIGTAVVLLIR